MGLSWAIKRSLGSTHGRPNLRIFQLTSPQKPFVGLRFRQLLFPQYFQKESFQPLCSLLSAQAFCAEHEFHETCHSVTLLFHEKRLQTMLWHHNARVNSHQRWKQTRFVCFHLWCELTSTLNATEVSWNSCAQGDLIQINLYHRSFYISFKMAIKRDFVLQRLYFLMTFCL